MENPNNNSSNDLNGEVKNVEDKPIEKLRAAVLEYMNERDYTDPRLILTDFIVLTAQHGYGDEGGSISAYAYLLSDDEMDWHKIFGLLHISEKRLTQQYLRDEEE